MSTASRIAWGLCALTVALTVAVLVLAAVDTGGPDSIAGVSGPTDGLAITAFQTLAFIAFAALASLVAARRPGNPIGWLLCMPPLALGAVSLGERVAWHRLLDEHEIDGVVQWALWVENFAWVGAVAPLFAFVPLLFPTGRALTRRWRAAGFTAAFGAVAVAAGYALAPGALENNPAVDNPLGGVAGMDVVAGLGFAVLVAGALASVASLAVRFHRSTGVEREQIKWVWTAAALLFASFVASGLLESFVGEAASWPVLLAGLLAIPAAVAAAILRYRLYDIDVVVNRTLVYGGLTALLGATYLLTVLVLQLVINPLTEDSHLAVAGSTLAVAALFGPARARIQRVVDRRFYRHKYDATLTLERFSAHLRDQVDIDSLRGELLGVLSETMQPMHLSLWLRDRG